jgi:hypothetical protein
MPVDGVYTSAFCLWLYRIDDDLRCTGIEMLLKAIADLRLRAPSNECIDKSVTSAVF